MKIFAVDFGEARTGLAISDPTEFLASPAGVIYEKRFEVCVQKVAAAAKEQGAEEIVVGLPLNMDGSKGFRAELCEEFAKALQEQVEVPVKSWDERRTTIQAANYLNEMNVRGKKRKSVIDELAATLILENYLSFRRNHPTNR